MRLFTGLLIAILVAAGVLPAVAADTGPATPTPPSTPS